MDLEAIGKVRMGLASQRDWDWDLVMKMWRGLEASWLEEKLDTRWGDGRSEETGPGWRRRLGLRASGGLGSEKGRQI